MIHIKYKVNLPIGYDIRTISLVRCYIEDNPAVFDQYLDNQVEVYVNTYRYYLMNVNIEEFLERTKSISHWDYTTEEDYQNYIDCYCKIR